MKQKIKTQLESLTTLLITNPVVVRDLRAQMRGTKSYWYQGAWLLLLGVLAIAGYAQATQQTLISSGYPGSNAGHHVNIVDAQQQLQTLYTFIFGTIAIMICLIAPALTAASIVGERQRLSFDLLVTTPLRATELLVGKLVSSIAFLGLLLLLSLPASALCVLLGGATLADVFRVYAMLAIDGVVLAAIGLFFSCASKTNLLAIVWSYATVGAFLLVTYTAAMIGTNGDLNQTSGLASLDSALGALNPIVAITHTAGRSVGVHGFQLPIWLAMIVPAVLGVRLLLTAATYRLGSYGRESGPSLRKQALVLSVLVGYALMDGVFTESAVSSQSIDRIQTDNLLLGAISVAFIALAAFLPGLFVPVSGDDTPVPSERDTNRYSRYGYRIARAFQPEHAGSLPYFHIVALTVTAAGLLAVANAFGLDAAAHALPVAGIGLVYVSGLGFLLLQLARLSARISSVASGARGLTFGIFALLAVVPLMVFGLSGIPHWEDSWLACAYIFYPLLQTSGQAMENAALVATAICYGIGFAFLLADRATLARRSRRAAAPLDGAAA